MNLEQKLEWNRRRDSRIVLPGTREFDNVMRELRSDRDNYVENSSSISNPINLGTPSEEVMEYCRSLEEEFRNYDGFHSSGFPIWYLTRERNNFKVGENVIHLLGAFTYMNYLVLERRLSEAMELETKLKKQEGFFENGFPKLGLNHSTEEPEVVSSVLFSYLIYLSLTRRNEEARALERDWEEYEGFCNFGLPRNEIVFWENGSNIIDDNITPSGLFHYLTYLMLDKRSRMAEGLENKFKGWGGFHNNGFPKWKLAPYLSVLRVKEDYVVSSGLFSYMTYLALSKRNEEARVLEREWRKYGGFHENEFPKMELILTNNEFRVRDEDVSSYSLFSYLNYKLISSMMKDQ